MSDSHAPVTRILPFQDECASSRAQLLTDQTDAGTCDRVINNVLSSFGLIKIDVPMNEDCLFSSVILHLNTVFVRNTDVGMIEHLHSIGVNQANIDVHLLRNLMVDEWIINSQEYKAFLSDVSEFEIEADKYRNSSVYTTELGDAMLFGFSNVLHLQLIVFTSISSWPYLTINPHCAIASREPICLAYIHEGSGHYCLAVKAACTIDKEEQVTNLSIKSKTKICRCGLGRNADDSDHVNCTSSHHYSSRCPCLKEKIP